MVNIKDHIFPWISITSKRIDNFHSHKFKELGFDLTKEQWVLLKVLLEHNGIPQNELACNLNRDKTTITRLINTMEKKNYIARINSQDDKRVNKIFITTQGEKILKETEQITLDIINSLQNNISENDLNTAIQVLSKIQKNIDNIKSC